jgi:predicted MFS family arabinose efflux permease
VSFGAAAILANGAGGSALVIPVFAAVVFVVRAFAGSVPDRAGPERTLLCACPATAAGLCGVALLGGTPLIVASIAVLAAGQALTVPALGVIALRGVPSSQHGAAAGLFFAWFDAGVGLGGPLAGLAAHLSSAAGALIAAAVAVAAAPFVAAAARFTRTRARADSLAT